MTYRNAPRVIATRQGKPAYEQARPRLRASQIVVPFVPYQERHGWRHWWQFWRK